MRSHEVVHPTFLHLHVPAKNRLSINLAAGIEASIVCGTHFEYSLNVVTT